MRRVVLTYKGRRGVFEPTEALYHLNLRMRYEEDMVLDH